MIFSYSYNLKIRQCFAYLLAIFFVLSVFSVITRSAFRHVQEITSEEFKDGSGGGVLSVSIAVANVNNDDFDDVILAIPEYDCDGEGPHDNCGKAWLFLGSETGISTIPAWSYTGENESHFGMALACAGDVNSDNHEDVIVTSLQVVGSQSGYAYLFAGTSEGLSPAPVWSDSKGFMSLYGMSVAGIGDANRDGYDDVAVGAPGGPGDPNSGVWLYKGDPHTYLYVPPTPDNPSGQHIPPPEDTSYFGYSVAGAGDVNNSEYDDLIVGYQAVAEEGIITGYRAYVYNGIESPLLEPWVIVSADNPIVLASSSKEFGINVNSAGDVNSDGYDDVIIASKYGIWIFNGSENGISPDKPISLPSFTPGSGEYWVGPLGDVNDDGYDDVGVCVPKNPSSFDRIRIYIGDLEGIRRQYSWRSRVERLLAWARIQQGVSYDNLFKANINNDAYSDLACWSVDNNISIYFGYDAAPKWRNQKTNDSDNIVAWGDSIVLTAEGLDEYRLCKAILQTDEGSGWINRSDEYDSPILIDNVTNQWVTTSFTWQNVSVENSTIVYWRIWYVDDKGNATCTNTMSFRIHPTGEVAEPKARNPTQNKAQLPLGGINRLAADGFDECALAYAWLETNEGHGWINRSNEYGSPQPMNNVKDTWVKASFDWQNDSFPETDPPVTIYWRIWFNDTVDNRTNTSIMSFTLGVPPSYRNVGTNDSDNLIKRGDAIELRAEGYDDGGLSNSSLMIKVNNQPWEEYERIELEGVARTWVWTNFTWQNSSVEEWSTVYWHIIYRDLVGKESTTPTKSFKITPILWSRVFGSGDCLKATPALGDLNNDGILEIVLPWKGKVYVLSGVDGSTIWESFTFGTTTYFSYSSPVIVDLDNDGQLDFVVAAMRDGNEIQAFNLNTPFPLWSIIIDDHHTSQYDEYHSSPAIAWLNDDLIPEIIVGTRTPPVGRVYAIHGNNGSIYWSCDTGAGRIYSTPAIGDLSGDGIPDVVISGGLYGDENLTVIYGNNGTIMWKYKIGDTRSSPALADLNNDGNLEIVAGSWDGLYVLSSTGTLLWRNSSLGVPFSSPSIAELDGDDFPEIIVMGGSALYAIHGINDSMFWSYPCRPRASPAITDINSDGLLDVIIGSDKKLYAINSSNGKLHWEFTVKNDLHASPTVGDINNNGLVDIICVEEGDDDLKIRIYALEFKSIANDWPFFRGDAFRRACLNSRNLTLKRGWNSLALGYSTFAKASQILQAIPSCTRVAFISATGNEIEVYEEGGKDLLFYHDACMVYVEEDTKVELCGLQVLPSTNFATNSFTIVPYLYNHNLTASSFIEQTSSEAIAYWDNELGRFVMYTDYYTNDGFELEYENVYLIYGGLVKGEGV